MSSKDVFNFNMYFDSEDVYRRVQYMGNMAKGWDSSLSLETSTLQENAVYPTNSLIEKLSENSKKSTFMWLRSFDKLKNFCFKHLEMDSTMCSITQNQQRKSIKAKSLTVNYDKTGTLQLQRCNPQSAKDKLRAAMDLGQTNCEGFLLLV